MYIFCLRFGFCISRAERSGKTREQSNLQLLLRELYASGVGLETGTEV